MNNFDEIKNFKRGNIGLAQLNFIAGDIEYNAKKIVKNINLAQDMNLDLVVFPEMSLVGYPLKDTVSRHPFLIDENIKWLKEIAKLTTKITAIIGFLGVNNTSAIAVVSNGKIQKIIEDISQIEINGIEYSISTSKDDVEDEKAQVIIKCFNTSSRKNKEQNISNLLSYIAKTNNKPLVYLNQVGATDNYSFDGASRVYDKNGELFAQAKSFEEDFLIVNPLENYGKISPITKGLDEQIEESFSLDYENDLERVYKTIIQGIRDYFNKNGLERAVLGLSGGLDSTVASVLLADALGKENVFGVSMPSKITSDESRNDAEELAKNLGIHYTEMPIKSMVDTTNEVFAELFSEVEKGWDCRYQKSFTQDNIQARSRAIYLWGIANEFSKCVSIATSDKSELYMGYATINGDMSGGFAPIADVTKTKLFALARWLNKNREVKNAIPESIILKRPGAELAIDERTGKPLCAEDALMPYEFLDEIIWRVEHKQETYNDMLNSEFVYEKTHSVSKEQKQEWLEKFYRRMSFALFKWSIMPPSVIVDTHSINSSDYNQPVATSRIDYKGHSEEQIREILENV